MVTARRLAATPFIYFPTSGPVPRLDPPGRAAALVNSSAPVDGRDGRTCGLASQRPVRCVVASSGCGGIARFVWDEEAVGPVLNLTE